MSAEALDAWKRAAAARIHAANPEQVYGGAPPLPLAAVVVVRLTVLADGSLFDTELMRVPDHAEDLGAAALDSVERAGGLPPLPESLAGHAPLEILETWLFRDDGRFQLRSLAPPQAEE